MLSNRFRTRRAEPGGLLKGNEKVLGVEHPNTLVCVNNLALVFEYERKYEAFEEMKRRAPEGYEKVLGVDHPNTLASVHNLSYLLHAQQRFRDASILYPRALAGLSKTLGPDHPVTQICILSHASLARDMKGWGRDNDHSRLEPENIGRTSICMSLLSIRIHYVSKSSLGHQPRTSVGLARCHCLYYSPF